MSGDSLVKDVQCYELFGGITLKNHTFIYIFLKDVTPSGLLPSTRSRPTGSRMEQRPAVLNRLFMMLLIAEFRGNRSALKRHESR